MKLLETANRWSLILGLAVLLPYLPSLANGFVWLDTEYLANGSILVRDPHEFVGLLSGELQRPPHYYRPLVSLLMSVGWELWGPHPFWFHLQSLLIHVACVLLLFHYLTTTLSRRFAFCAALAWGLLPASVSVVGVIQSVGDSLALAFVLLSLIALERFLRRGVGGRGDLVTAAVALLCSFLSKEASFAFPLFLAPYLFLKRRDFSRVREAALLVASLTLIFGALQVLVIDYAVPDRGPLLQRVLSFVPVYVRYITLTFTSVQLTISDTAKTFDAYGGEYSLYLALFFALCAIQVVAYRKIPRARGGLLWFNIFLLPVAQVVPLLHFRADRFLYIPAVGLVWAIVASLEHYAYTPALPLRWVRRLAGVGTLVVVIFAVRIVFRSDDFRDDLTLFAREVRTDVQYREGHSFLGLHYARLGSGYDSLATRHFVAALEASPDTYSYVQHAATLANMTAVLLRTNQNQLICDLVTEHAKARGGIQNLALLYNVSVASIRLKKWSEAIHYLTKYHEISPRDPGGIFLLGKAHLSAGNSQQALEFFTLYVRLFPNSPDRKQVEDQIEKLRVKASQ